MNLNSHREEIVSSLISKWQDATAKLMLLVMISILYENQVLFWTIFCTTFCINCLISIAIRCIVPEAANADFYCEGSGSQSVNPNSAVSNEESVIGKPVYFKNGKLYVSE